MHGFRSFDERDVLGFVDGTENPEGQAAGEAVLIADEDPAFAGGSYVIVQKYVHDLRAWDALSTEEQEFAIGRTKLNDIELPDEDKPPNSHLALNVITGPDGEERQIMRFNMPFGRVGAEEFGTYYIAYARTSELIELMLTNMFIGDPPGNTDRILDFSTALTGTLFFVPSGELLESLVSDDESPRPTATPTPASPTRRRTAIPTLAPPAIRPSPATGRSASAVCDLHNTTQPPAASRGLGPGAGGRGPGAGGRGGAVADYACDWRAQLAKPACG